MKNQRLVVAMRGYIGIREEQVWVYMDVIGLSVGWRKVICGWVGPEDEERMARGKEIGLRGRAVWWRPKSETI